MRRLFVPRERIEATTRLEGEALHYLGRVLRLRPGEELELFDGAGAVYPARLQALDAEAAVLAVGPPSPAPTAPPITLAQGLAKGDKLDLVVQKATELGASRIVPLAAERSVVKLTAEKGLERARRWRRIAEEAARQCGRADVPEVDPPATLAEFLAAAAARGEAVALLYEGEKERRLSAWLAAHAAGPVALAIGPEGGFSSAEVEAARAAGAATVSLGPRIVRTETAGLAALAVALHLAGELG
jgi:16S rRNA (uracil1498-N3)-methyltransferase